MQSKTVIFIGPQGSGKGTQTAKLLEYLRGVDDRPVVDLETGRGFRELAQGDSFTGQRVREVLERGELIPNFLTSSIVMGEVAERITPDAHLVIDGFPRNLDQARVLEQMMGFYQRSPLTVVHLAVPDEVVIARMKSRARIDDTDELIAERLRLYKEQTEPLVAHYRQAPGTHFVAVDATQTIDEVFAEIKQTLHDQ